MKKLFWTGFVLFLFLALLSAQPVFAENNQENTVKFQPVREHVSMVS